jgi:VanZ family protein
MASRLVDFGLWAASLGLLVLSFVFSWGPPPPSPEVGWFDKVWHYLGYGVLCGTLLLAAVWRRGRGPGRFPRASLLIAALVLLVAWLTEALQAPFGRDVQLTDALADLAGVASGLMGWRAISGGAAPVSPPGSGRTPPHTTRSSIPE